jgi:signal peptide peptidase SppA
MTKKKGGKKMVTGNLLLETVSGQPWLIRKDKLELFNAILLSKMSGSYPTTDSPKVNSGSVVIASTGILPIEGTLLKKTYGLESMSGMQTITDLTKSFEALQSDASVARIVLQFDSPGGSVSGIQEFANAIRNSSKETIGFISGECCSAAYWLASQCSAIVASSNTDLVGSIGVYLSVVDQSMINDAMGLKVHVISAGKYKAIGNPNTPMTEMGIEYLQEQVDSIYNEFTKAVQSNRPNVNSDISVWADGKVFMASKAKELGLIDEIATMKDLII